MVRQNCVLFYSLVVRCPLSMQRSVAFQYPGSLFLVVFSRRGWLKVSPHQDEHFVMPKANCTISLSSERGGDDCSCGVSFCPQSVFCSFACGIQQIDTCRVIERYDSTTLQNSSLERSPQAVLPCSFCCRSSFEGVTPSSCKADEARPRCCALWHAVTGHHRVVCHPVYVTIYPR